MKYILCAVLTLCMLAIAGSGSLRAQTSALQSDSLPAAGDHHSAPADSASRLDTLQRHARGIALCLDLWREFLFDLVASGSERRQLAEIAAERNAARDDHERNLLAIREAQFRTTIIEYALENRYFTRIQLDSLQLRKAEQLTYYAGVAIDRGQSVLKDSAALSTSLPTIIAGMPRQIQELQFYLQAVPALQQRNRLRLPDIAQN